MGKWLLIGGVVLFLLVVVGGIVMFVMNKSDEEHDESRSEEREEEDLDTRRDDNYELTETKMDHHTMDRDMDHWSIMLYRRIPVLSLYYGILQI